MNINQLRKGILISKRAENKNAVRMHFELGRWSIGSKNIKLYPKIVFGLDPSGRYIGATHYETPYTYSLDEFEKRFHPTGIATARRIRKLFINSGCQIDLMPPIKKSAYSETAQKQNMKFIAHLEENEWKEIKELQEENEKLQEEADFWRCCVFAAEAENEMLETEMLSEAADQERREYLDWTHGKKSGYGPNSFMCYMSDYD